MASSTVSNGLEQARSLPFPSEVTVVGAGNISHYLMCALTMIPQTKVTVFATHKNHSSKLREVWSTIAPEGLVMAGALGDGSADMDRLYATEDPTQAFGSACGCVIFSLPAAAYSGYLDLVCRYASQGTVLLGLPGVGCLEWAVAKACKKVGRNLSDFKVVLVQDVPLSCRVGDFGKKVFVRGKKEDGILLGCLPPGRELCYCAWVEQILRGQVRVQPASALQVAIGTGCMVSHSFTLQVVLQELDAGRELEAGELLWYGREYRSKGMDDADQEWQKVASAVLKRSQCKKAPPIVWELLSFREMWRRWYPETKDHSTLAGAVANLSAYQWTTVPLMNGARAINFEDKKITQDIPFCLCLVVMLGKAVGLPTPIFDACVQYMQKKMGKDYLRFSSDAGSAVIGNDLKYDNLRTALLGGEGEARSNAGGTTVEPGEDLKHECYFMELLTGDIGLDAFLNFYTERPIGSAQGNFSAARCA